MKNRKISFFITAILLGSLLPAQTEKTVFPGIKPIFTQEKKSKELSPDEIIMDALRFSFCEEDSDKWNKAILKYNELKADLQSERFLQLSEEKKASSILNLMYKKVLTQYKEKQTSLSILFDNGTYNCVSSSVLYLALAKYAGLKVYGNKTPSHAFCTVVVDGEKIDIETTNPLGFNPGTKRIVSKTENTVQYAVIPRTYYENRSAVSDKVFVALIGTNMSVIFMNEKEYDIAVPVGVTRLAYVQGEPERFVKDAREDFDSICINYSILLERKGKYLDSAEWNSKILSGFGVTEKMQESMNNSVHNAVADFINKEKYLQAQKIIDHYKALISAEVFTRVSVNVFLAQLQSELDKADVETGLALVEKAYENPFAKDKRASETLYKWREYYVVEKINSVMNEGKYLEAAKIADKGINLMPGSTNVRQAKKLCMQNYDASVHNRFAEFANKKQYEKAMEVLEEGLSNNPQSRTLQNDKKQLLQRMK